MAKIDLVRPNVGDKESFLLGLREFQVEGLPWVMDLKIEELERNFERFVEAELKKKTFWTKDTPVEETEYWAMTDGTYVGRVSIRHKLNKDLERMGGHIGYDTRPSYRGQGIATEMLRLAIPIAEELGITTALITCNDNNVASIKVIEKNGGVLKEIKPPYEGAPLKRYYHISTARVSS